MPNRIEGQIWIDKSSPYNLKYHVSGTDYTVQIANSYHSSTAPLYSGTVVKFTSSNNISPAEFPDDIDNILGVVVNSITSSNEPISVTQTGYLVLDKKALDNVFFAGDLSTSFNGFDTSSGIGAPVYWFIGRQNPDYSYIDSNINKGKLTLATPTGMKWKVSEVTDNSMNVNYDNLPQVGTIASYTIDNDEIVEMNIHLNLSSFDSSLEWSWPYIQTEDEATSGKIEGTTTREGIDLIIRHGLFADYRVQAQQVSDVELFAGDNYNESKYTVNTSYTNITTGADRKTIIKINTPETMYYKASGNIRYKFNEQHN